jgi:hypothetical protein
VRHQRSDNHLAFGLVHFRVQLGGTAEPVPLFTGKTIYSQVKLEGRPCVLNLRRAR